jgi:hypothetical protein
LETDNLYKFYLDLDAMEKLEQEVSEFNRYYEQKIEQGRAEKARKKEIEAQKELVETLKEMEARRRAHESGTETVVITTRTKSDYGPIGVEEQIKNHFSNLKRRLRSGPTRGGSFEYNRQPRPDFTNPHTGEYYPQSGPGVINPHTGEYYPQSGSGFINPRTGEYYPQSGPGAINP